ncbi:AGE family epimerase/isomerase [Paracoccus caeni]|uniref:AGE family epimerase/isomerase n=1 Tax=Paracoccus caeni TaxID=657651 RepID=A0A934SIT5_9RHOB|nr:AGE family epimerase/isomerase [Paracoccus caeni]MBK4215233.1 AGE family epimerase/isomerase [Paracoccus caeni]
MLSRQWGTKEHRDWLIEDAGQQFAFYRGSLNPDGGFDYLDDDGRPLPDQVHELHATGRMVHSFALGHAAGLVGDTVMIDHGLDALWNRHRDAEHGGYVWSFGADGQVADGSKLAYGHAFVLLAAAGAKVLGHPDADRLLDDITEVIDRRYWDAPTGRMREEYARDWSEISDYRGMNANMHSTEAFLAAFEATGERLFLDRALGLIRFFVGEMGAANGWRLPEHFDLNWQPDPDYEGNPMFRPAGTTPGHAFEWARLAVQAWDLDGRRDGDLLDWAKSLYHQARADGWKPDDGGSVVYTVDQQGRVLRDNRYWWPVTEAIGTAAVLIKTGEDLAGDYKGYWDSACAHFVDEDRGGWYPDQHRDGVQFSGKPDIYHSIQAVLFPLVPEISGLTRALEKVRG